jgi:hypothetical protein
MALELVSVHFPKAAGSTLASALKGHFGDALAFDYSHDPVNPDHILSEPPAHCVGIRAVHGHFRGDRYEEQRNAFRFTFLREPVENLISIYYYWRSHPTHGNPTHDLFLREQPTIVDFAAHCWPIRRLMSMSYFGGVDIRTFDFVGFYETRIRDLARLSSQIGVSFPPHVHSNPTAPHQDRQLLLSDKIALSTLRSVLADDVAFYESARAHWD